MKTKMVKEKKINQNRAIAYHEAGHAVAASVLGVEFEKVYVVVDGGGALDLRDWGNQADNSMCENIAIVCHAGSFAHRLIDQSAPEFISSEDDLMACTHRHLAIGIVFGDVHLSNRKLRKAASALLEAHENYIKVRTELFVKDHRKQIRAVAEALLKQQELTPEKVAEIISNTP